MAVIIGTPGNDRLTGMPDENNEIYGLAGNDRLEGGALADSLL